jgi:hypothetical protein
VLASAVSFSLQDDGSLTLPRWQNCSAVQV